MRQSSNSAAKANKAIKGAIAAKKRRN